MPILSPKQPTETVLYELSFALAFKQSEDVIESYTIDVASGAVTIANDWSALQTVYANLTGGANNTTSIINLVVTTALGQVLNRSYSLFVSSTAVSVDNSTTTKRQIVEMMFTECGLAGYEFDATPEEQAQALLRLDALMAQWCGPGESLALPYNFPHVMGGSDLDDASGIPDFAFNCVSIALALRFCPALGKTMSAETKSALQSGMNAIRNSCTTIPERILPPYTLRGAGAKPLSTWQPFNNNNNSGS